MRDTVDAAGHTAAGATTRRERALDFGVESGTEDRPHARSLTQGQGVYPGRPLRPLPEAVGRALDLGGRDEITAEAPDWSALWSRPELAARLVQMFADHAVSCRAGRVLAPDPGDRELAAPVAAFLGLPLETARRADESAGGGAGRAFPVARMLHDREVAEIGGRGDPTGAATVVRIADRDSRIPDSPNILSIITL